MYITWPLNGSEYQAIVSDLNLFLKKHSLDPLNRKKRSDSNAMITYGLARYGFEEIRLRNNLRYGYRAIEILLRPKLLVEIGNYNNVTHLHEFVIVRHNFNQLLRNKIGLDVPDLFGWKVKRIDNAIDLKIDENLLSKYMFLFKKGNLPNYTCNPTSLRYFGETNNVYIISKNFRINWYDRYLTQCKKQEKTKKQFNNLEQLKGILRLEIQNRDVQKSTKPKENTVLNFLELGKSQKRIMHFYDLIVGSGTYYTYDRGMRLIERIESPIRKRALQEIYALINEEGSIWEARMKYVGMKLDTKKAANDFSKRLGQIRNLGINPVPLSPEWEIETLPNLRSDIVNYFTDYLEKQNELEQRELTRESMTI